MIWRWRDPCRRISLAYLDTRPFEFSVWHELATLDAARLDEILQIGRHMNRKYDSLAQIMAQSAEPVCLSGVQGTSPTVPACSPPGWASCCTGRTARLPCSGRASRAASFMSACVPATAPLTCRKWPRCSAVAGTRPQQDSASPQQSGLRLFHCPLHQGCR